MNESFYMVRCSTHMPTCQSLITLTFLVQGDTSFPHLQKALTNQGFVWTCFNKTFCRESNLGFGRIKHGFPWVDHSSWLCEEVCDTKNLAASFVAPHPWSSIHVWSNRNMTWIKSNFRRVPKLKIRWLGRARFWVGGLKFVPGTHMCVVILPTLKRNFIMTFQNAGFQKHQTKTHTVTSGIPTPTPVTSCG